MLVTNSCKTLHFNNVFFFKKCCDSLCICGIILLCFPGICQPLTYSSDIRCLAYMERYTYNPNTDTCDMFVYGGCGGTANNFLTEDACNTKCKRSVATATEEPETASPAGDIFSYFYLSDVDSFIVCCIINWRITKHFNSFLPIRKISKISLF